MFVDILISGAGVALISDLNRPLSERDTFAQIAQRAHLDLDAYAQGEGALAPNHQEGALDIEDLNVRRDFDDQSLLVEISISSDSSQEVETDLYIDGVRESVTVPPNGALYGRWVPT